MKVALDYQIRVDDTLINSRQLAEQCARGQKPQVTMPPEGVLLFTLDGQAYGFDLLEPLVRLMSMWLRKLPWVLAGDTETVAYHNSEHCCAFVPAGDSVELSLFAGTENEVEEYIVEPSTVRLDHFTKESLNVAERLLEAVKTLDVAFYDTDEDCRDLKASLDEARSAWRDYQLHQRR